MPISQQVADAMQRASWIRRMFEEGNRLKATLGADNVFDLSLGNPVMEPPAAFREELRRLVSDPTPGMHRYMSNQGYEDTRRAIADRYASECGVNVGADGVVLSVGAAGGLNVLFHSLLDPGSEVVIFAPFFPEYLFYVTNHAGKTRVVNTTEDFLLDPDALGEVLGPQTRAVVICSPNNPTGRLYPASNLSGVVEVMQAKAPDALLVADEPYRRIAFDGLDVPCILNHTNRSVVVSSHSKDIGLPGERIGFILVHPDLPDRDQLMNAMIFSNRTLGFVNAPALIQRAVAAVQDATVDVAEYQRKRDRLWKALTDAGYKCVRPEGAFYMFPQSPEDDDVAFVRRLQEYGVLVVPGSGFGAPGHFRISYCVDDHVIDGALEGLRKAITDRAEA